MIEVRGLTKAYGDKVGVADLDGFGVLCGWVALTIVAAAVLLPRRDV